MRQSISTVRGEMSSARAHCSTDAPAKKRSSTTRAWRGSRPSRRLRRERREVGEVPHREVVGAGELQERLVHERGRLDRQSARLAADVSLGDGAHVVVDGGPERIGVVGRGHDIAMIRDPPAMPP